MRYFFCLSCKRKSTTQLGSELLRCPYCKTYEKHLFIEVDNKYKSLKDKRGLNEFGWKE
jgi:DNA-directed RNA polymerase subunit RPC12/RpoP